MSLHVSPTAPDELVAASLRLFPNAPDPVKVAENFRLMIAAGDVEPNAFWVAREGGTIVGAMFAYLIGGRQAAVWVPRADRADVEDALVGATFAWFRENGVRVVQAVLDDDDCPHAAALERTGMRYVTEIVFAARKTQPSLPRDVSQLEIRAVPSSLPELAALLLRTYEGTLDLPELNGTRTASDIISAYETDWNDETPLWFLATHASVAVGVLCLSLQPDNAVELTYLGIVPEARGRGFGEEILQYALDRATVEMAYAIHLSIDARNAPALRLYRKHGFDETARRKVYLAIGIG